jgi:hypothetical protein
METMILMTPRHGRHRRKDRPGPYGSMQEE